MKHYSIAYQGGCFHCVQFGQGEHLLVAFHGFGDQAGMFVELEEALGERYTVVALDLPFHGQTEWPYETFNRADLLAVIERIRWQLARERISLMGFSFGARLALGMLPDLIPRLERLFLLSPDGIRTHSMWWALHTPICVRRWLARVLKNPTPVVRLLEIGRRLGWVSPHVIKFIKYNLKSYERRQRTFGCWLSLNAFYMPPFRFRQVIEQSNLLVDIFIGAKDTIIHRETVYRLMQGLANVRVFQLNTGHRIVGEALAEQMKGLFT
ncbi:MAG: alpha/beta hydrolase [Saprospiraceae bacterium]|nr:alpha/beta hydrolase [Saprospiraceae bacterium]MDW8484492.1 alpha/beta fold hydrolase [Saprospiraceae bacterium]